MKTFHTVTAVLETLSGLLLILAPALAASFLFGAPEMTPVELALARMAGVALLALGAACWLARKDVASSAARGLASGMLIYNAGVAAVLVYAGIGLGIAGIGLWPAVAIHVAMTIWNVFVLVGRRAQAV